jgi:hypothetical protein
MTWPAGEPFVRGDTDSHGALAFNPPAVVHRLRPVRDSGAVVASADGGETGTIAPAETVLRQAATSGGALHLTELRGLRPVKVSSRTTSTRLSSTVSGLAISA